MLNYTHSFLLAAITTIFIETVILFLIIRFLWKKEKFDFNNARLLFSGFLASFATIPYVWYVFPVLIYRSQNVALMTSEFLAFFVEGLVYYFILNISFKKGFFISFSCNLVSFLLGKIIF
ncbi:MAG: hypothetical protein PHP62_02770 [Candidatus Moranbacteria bacterium]|nr:hypothetical protein [Candidatus Moranbacteria bacterium]